MGHDPQWRGLVDKMTILDFLIGMLVVTNICVCVLLICSNLYSPGQKFAQCVLVWLVPIFGALGIGAFLLSQYRSVKYDTRAYPERSEKMINAGVGNENHHHVGHSVGHSGSD